MFVILCLLLPVDIVLVSQWFDNAISVGPEWSAECGSSVETADHRVPCYVQDSCSLSVMSQVSLRCSLVCYLLSGVLRSFLVFLISCSFWEFVVGTLPFFWKSIRIIWNLLNFGNAYLMVVWLQHVTQWQHLVWCWKRFSWQKCMYK